MKMNIGSDPDLPVPRIPYLRHFSFPHRKMMISQGPKSTCDPADTKNRPSNPKKMNPCMYVDVRAEMDNDGSEANWTKSVEF